ncbi:hypothetical protein ASD16_12790 [Cellulomonas sp. Root485]|uniref:hypothetical protein n=1 Tax=Cellulomonas sp. Root485 TaxID=1736546 RepID=UPI0006FD9016|nr:hypothetical protein [Cellulomonas sp. Root485]KQY23405.1 hypothetical protein ASD16_12790 [Cellulomonas sp. Root485]
MDSDWTLQSLTLDEAFRAAYFMIDQYVALESSPDVGLVLLHQYMKSDPARWDDWTASVRRALSNESAHQDWLHD